MAATAVGYKAWMVGGDPAGARRAAAQALKDAITTRHIDFASFKDLIVILNHEYLCVKFPSDATGNSAANTIDRASIALDKQFLDGLLETLCETLIQSYSNTEYLERELQFRALLATVTLLIAKGVHAVEQDFHNRVTSRLRRLFTNLQWEQGVSGDLTSAKFFKIQCSFLLSTVAESFARFRQATPLAVSLVSRAINFISFGLSVTAPALGAGPPVNLQILFNLLNAALGNIPHAPDARYQRYFALHELSMLAVAATTYCDVLYAVPELVELAQVRKAQAEDFVRVALESARSLLVEHPQYENNVSPPARYWQNFQAATSCGPPDFREYYYFYGVVDCIVQAHKASHLLSQWRDLDIILGLAAVYGTEASHRWKALEYFAVHVRDPVRVLGQHINDPIDGTFLGRVRSEMTALFSGQIPVYPIPPSQSEPTERIPATEWKEDNIPALRIDAECSHRRLSPTPPLLKRVFVKEEASASGISPDCNSVFILDSKVARVYKTPTVGTDEEATILVQHQITREKFIQAALSNEYFVSISKTELHITRYNANIASTSVSSTKKEHFDSDSVDSTFIPRCLAVSGDWIAVGGETSTDSFRSGSLRIYRILTTPDGCLCILRNPVAFNRPSPDPLKRDQVTSLNFSPNGGRLVCVTKNNRILTWFLSNNLRPRNGPFIISKQFAMEPGIKGITSATLFQIRPGRPYVLATTWPSSQRANQRGEWSFISPVGSRPGEIPKDLDNDIFQLEDAGPIISAAVSVEGGCIAMREKNGNVRLLPLKGGAHGGIKAQYGIVLKQETHRIANQDEASSCSMRFRISERGLELFVIDLKGLILHKVVAGSEMLTRWSSPRPSLLSVAAVSSLSDRTGSLEISRATTLMHNPP